MCTLGQPLYSIKMFLLFSKYQILGLRKTAHCFSFFYIFFTPNLRRTWSIFQNKSNFKQNNLKIVNLFNEDLCF